MRVDQKKIEMNKNQKLTYNGTKNRSQKENIIPKAELKDLDKQ